MRSVAALVAIVLTVSLPSVAAEALTGTSAAPDGRARVTAAMTVTPRTDGALAVDMTMTAIGQQRAITRYEAELSKQLHLIAISRDFSTFVHEHADRADAGGRFRATLHLPRPGPYYVYADAVPAGLGQQVMRFALDAGSAPAVAPGQPVPSLEAADGPYAVRFDPFVLRAGEEGELRLHLLRDNKPAADVTPFLGVAAHAVFIAESDLSYVHVHATAAAPQPSIPSHQGMDMPAPLRPGARVPSDLTLHVLAPRAGIYRLWVQFMAGGRVRTVPFVVPVT